MVPLPDISCPEVTGTNNEAMAGSALWITRTMGVTRGESGKVAASWAMSGFVIGKNAIPHENTSCATNAGSRTVEKGVCICVRFIFIMRQL